MGHYVYKYVLNDEIIYIGKCDSMLCNRIYNHGRAGDNITPDAWEDINNSEVYYIVLANRIMSDIVESELIRRYKPKYNIAKKSEWSGLPFVEPKWEKYNIEEDRKNRAIYDELNQLRMIRDKLINQLNDATNQLLLKIYADYDSHMYDEILTNEEIDKTKKEIINMIQ